MNRSASLRRSLASWSELSEVDEIVLVDWGSKIPLATELRITDDRIRIVRVTGRRYWENARCHNLEWRLASGDYILRLDSDYLVARHFINRHPLPSGAFWAGDWRGVPPEADDKRNLTGALFIERQHLRSVNGYNERLTYYGKEDDDLYARLEKSGLRRMRIDLSTMNHIPHSDEERYKHLLIADAEPLSSNLGSYEWTMQRGFAHCTEKIDRLLKISTAICLREPWNLDDRMTKWATQRVQSPAYLYPSRMEVCKECSNGEALEDDVWTVVE
jgi:glycosyltransferase involved in cell wall biosynthesis